MSKWIDTIDGVFGEKIHYQDGKRIGESWPGLFSHSYNHYDNDGNHIGYSDIGVFADQIHYKDGHEVGCTLKNAFGYYDHYNDNGYNGSTIDTLFGESTMLNDDIF